MTMDYEESLERMRRLSHTKSVNMSISSQGQAAEVDFDEMDTDQMTDREFQQFTAQMKKDNSSNPMRA